MREIKTNKSLKIGDWVLNRWQKKTSEIKQEHLWQVSERFDKTLYALKTDMVMKIEGYETQFDIEKELRMSGGRDLRYDKFYKLNKEDRKLYKRKMMLINLKNG